MSRPTSGKPIIALAALVLVLPFAIWGTPQGHDFFFHISSWMEVARQWRMGILYPRWAALANFGLGEPRFIFYPPVTWILGAVLSFIFPWKTVPGIFVFLALLLAGLSMRRLAREWLPDRDATLAAILYLGNPYHLMVIYWRSAFAELLVSAALPMLVLHALRLTRGERRAWLPLTLIFAAIWLTNLPAALICTYCLAAVLLWQAIQTRKLNGIWQGALGMITAWALAAFFIIPAALEMKWVNIEDAIGPGSRPEDQFVTAWYTENGRLHGVAITCVCLALIAVALAWKNRRQMPPAWKLFALFVAASAFLMFRPSLFLWNVLPRLRYVQFPWRWLFVLNFAAVLLFAALASRARPILRGVTWTLALLLLPTMLGVARMTHGLPGQVDQMLADIQSGKGYMGVAEYGAPEWDEDWQWVKIPRLGPAEPRDDPSFKPGSIPPLSGHFKVLAWQPEKIMFSADLPKAETISLGLMYFPAWRATVNGAPAGTQDVGALVTLSLPAGHSDVLLTFARTRDRLIAGIFSLVTLIVLLIGLSVRQSVSRSAE